MALQMVIRFCMQLINNVMIGEMLVEKKAVIFGAGEWGRVAYFYYRNDIEISYYVDNDQTIWGTQLNGIQVCSPEILRNQNYTIIIANKRYAAEIEEQLRRDYGVQEVILFRIDEKVRKIFLEDETNEDTEELIIAFSHGLGNQMFQYALYRNFLKQNKKVKGDLSAYLKPGMMPFELIHFFPNIKLEYCSQRKKDAYLKENRTYIEEPPQGSNKETYNGELLKMEFGYIEGFHCSYKYAQIIREELLNDFCFPKQRDDRLSEFEDAFIQKNMVGVHVRRGDFLNPKYSRELGQICTKEYYLKAINFIKERCTNPVFCFFSNDMEWVKNNIKEEDALYMESSMFQEYYDWYDMYLMSLCKHNIIPNSTFGWWGAWLNQNPQKIVVAPKKWRSRWEVTDWCPPEWVLI